MSVTLQKDDGLGFFSCCSVRLERIIAFFNKWRKLPDTVISNGVFHLYGTDDNLFYYFFEHYKTLPDILPHSTLEYYAWHQFNHYKTLPFSRLAPFMKKHFSPNKDILDIKKALIDEYSIKPQNCLAVYYRGTDKKKEISPPSFDTYYSKIQESLKPEQQLLIQTDDAHFLDYMKAKGHENIIVIKQNTISYSDLGIHNEKTPAQNCEDMKCLLATMLILAECNQVILSISNISHWIVLFRGNVEGVHQWIGVPVWQSPGPKNIWV
jgi:hypothetical protein